jgi:hypothetical protein
MDTSTCFSLAPHSGPFESWPLRSLLLLDGVPCATQVPGCALRHQFALADGHLLVTDFDCPFEEATSFVLLNRKSQLVSCRTLAVPYGSYTLERFEWLDDRNARVTFSGNDPWLLTIRDWGIPLLRPRLRLGRIRAASLSPPTPTTP